MTARDDGLSAVIEVPGIPAAPLGGCHAVSSRELTWTSAIPGNLRASSASVEMEQALANLAVVLDAAGHDWRDLVRVNCYYASERIDSAAFADCQALLASTIGTATCAGSAVMLAPATSSRPRFAIDAVAAHRGSKEVLANVAGVELRPWAAAARSGSTIFVSSVVPAGALFDRASPEGSARDAQTMPGFFERSHSAYRNLARVIDSARELWPECNGMRDVVRLHQHITRPGIDLADFRRSRADLLRTGDFVSTTVLAAADDPDRPGHDPWIKIDSELAIGARQRIAVPGVWANPGGLHATLSGGLAFFQAQMGRDGEGNSVHAGDPERHVGQVFENIDRMLAGASLRWGNVVHARIFCRDRDQLAPAERHLRARTGDRACAVTALFAGFFDPRALLEIEITAAY